MQTYPITVTCRDLCDVSSEFVCVWNGHLVGVGGEDGGVDVAEDGNTDLSCIPNSWVGRVIHNDNKLQNKDDISIDAYTLGRENRCSIRIISRTALKPINLLCSLFLCQTAELLCHRL